MPSTIADAATLTPFQASDGHAGSAAQSPDKPEQAAETGGKLKICLLSYRSQPYSGGQGIYVRYLSRALVEAGHEVDVVSGEPYPILDEGVNLIKLPGLNLFAAENAMKAFKWSYIWQPLNFYEWLSHNSGGFPEPYTFSKRAARWLKKNSGNYDIVHDNQCLGYGLLDMVSDGLPVVATIHHPITRDRDVQVAAAETRLLRWLAIRWHTFLGMQKKVARKLPFIVTVSDCSKNDISEDFRVDRDKLQVVVNGIDIDVFRPRPDIPRKSNRLIATASADHPLKGLNYLIEALGQLRSEHPDLELVVIGSPKPGGVTEKLINRLGLQDAITFRHGITADEITELYASSTIAVTPSVYEGFGLPAGEAMACAVPLVSAAGGALPEVVGDAGIVVPVKDAPALASAIDGLLRDPEERDRLAAAGMARVHREFTWDKAAAETVAVYRQAIAAKK